MVTPPRSRLVRFCYEHSLSLIVLVLVVGTLAGQAVTGWHTYNDDLRELHRAPLGFLAYLRSGHFLEATFENWESEFLQMGMYVVLTVWLRQKGSSESKPLYTPEEVDREPDPRRKDAPWPVRAGGVALWLYRRSLAITFMLLFLASFWLHAVGGAEVESIERVAHGEPAVSTLTYMTGSRFWFESLQNWQSEFVSILSIVVLSIFLRQHGSPESKPVDASLADTGE